ncbi:unnamed protein product, partial [Staurois parvus]
IETVNELHVTRPKTPPKEEFVVIDVRPINKEALDTKLTSSLTYRSMSGKSHDRGKKEVPPWRSSDKHPTDTIRYNYLDNFDPIEQARQVKKDHLSSLSPEQAEPGAKKDSIVCFLQAAQSQVLDVYCS